MSVAEAETSPPLPDSLRPAVLSAGSECDSLSTRPISQEEFKALLAQHRQWLMAGRQGRQPDFSRVDFSGCDFSDVASPFPECSPYLVSLRQANLQNTKFGEVSLEGVDLRDANLKCAGLSGARNLLEDQLGGAKLCYAELPVDVAAFPSIEKVNELSKAASKLFVSMLLSCVYAWLAISSTTDAQLLMNTGTIKLPIIQYEIAVGAFYWAAPAVLLGQYLYFHIYMQRLWEASARLPAVFPGGERLDTKTYPWLFNDLVCRHFVQLKGQLVLASLQAGLCILLSWWVIPATLLLFWMRYVRRHDFVVTCLHIAMLFAAIWAGVQLYRLAVATLDRDDGHLHHWRRPLQDWNTYRCGLLSLALCLAPVFLSYGAFQGILPDRDDTRVIATPVTASQRTAGRAVDFLENRFGDLPFLDLREAELSVRPESWSGKDQDVSLVKGADLHGGNLRYARAGRAFLVRADLQESNLQYANLREANLQRADLENADLRGANLQEVNLEEANLSGAKLQGADLAGCDLRGASLSGASLDGNTKLAGAAFNAYTIKPYDGFDFSAHQAVKK